MQLVCHTQVDDFTWGTVLNKHKFINIFIFLSGDFDSFPVYLQAGTVLLVSLRNFPTSEWQSNWQLNMLDYISESNSKNKRGGRRTTEQQVGDRTRETIGSVHQ